MIFAVFLLCALSVTSAPMPGTIKHRTHSPRLLRRSGQTLSSYHPTSSFKTLVDRDVESLGLAKRSDGVPMTMGEMATSFLSSELGVNVNYRAGSNKNSALVQHAYLTQSHDDIPFANAVANVAFIPSADSLTGSSSMKVASYAHSFLNCTSVASSTPSLAYTEAVTIAQDAIGGDYINHTAFTGRPTLEYYVMEDQSAALTHVVQVRNITTGEWYEAFVNAHSGDVVAVTDYVAHASFNVPTFTGVDPTAAFSVVTDPEDYAVSPLGWTSSSTTNFTDTEGNNAIAFTSTDSKFRNTETTTESSTGPTFDFTLDLTAEPDGTQANIDTARTNAFYVVNMMHDLMYRYGFTEENFNFQDDNLGNDGEAGDPVQISVHDITGTDNAQFSTPADGQSGVMRMFLWTESTPQRDGAIENDIVIHEMTHGLTSRMTGGGTGRCLQTTEAGGLGEGWSDAMADWVIQSAGDGTIQDVAVGAYVFNTAVGLRSAPYSTDESVNALTYGSLQRLNEVHDIGEVWAQMLHVVHAGLVDSLGFASDALTNPDAVGGNTAFMHLFVDALALQPCNPSFVDARDAWYQADQIRFAGNNTCVLETAFASRGLGVNADASFTDDASLSTACGGTGTTTTTTTGNDTNQGGGGGRGANQGGPPQRGGGGGGGRRPFKAAGLTGHRHGH